MILLLQITANYKQIKFRKYYKCTSFKNFIKSFTFSKHEQLFRV